MNFTFLFFSSFALGILADVEIDNIRRVLTEKCPNILQSTSETLAKALVYLFDEVKNVWEDKFADIPSDSLIWTEVIRKNPNTLKLLSDVVNQRTMMSNDRTIDAQCNNAVGFFMNVIRSVTKRSYLMTRLFMEHSPWLKMKPSLLLQLHHRLRYTTLKDKYGLAIIDENAARELEEYYLYGDIFALKTESYAYSKFYRDFAQYKQTLYIDVIEESKYQQVLDKSDKKKIIKLLKNSNDLIKIGDSEYVKRTSNFFPTYYWMSLYHRMVRQHNTQLFEFSAENFQSDFSKFEKKVDYIIMKLIGGVNPLTDLFQKMELIVEFNIFSSFGKYLGIKEDYLSVRSKLVLLI